MWNYAILTKMAKKAGGPENLIQIFIKAGRRQMIPAVAGAGTAGVIVGTLGTKAYEGIKKRRIEFDQKLESAKQEFTDGINQYEKMEESEAKEVETCI